MVSGLVAATESPQLPPEARERVLAFLKLQRDAAAALDTVRPDLFVHRLIERLGLRRQQVFAAQADVVERLVSLAHVGELAASYVRRAPQATPREFARWFAAVAEAGGGGDEDEDETAARDAVAVLPMHAAKGLEFDHVFVCGLQSSRMPGARRGVVEPIPPGCWQASAPPADTREEHVAEMRRVLHVGDDTGPRGPGVVLCRALRARCAAALRRRSPKRRARRWARSGRTRRAALRSRRGAARGDRTAARRTAQRRQQIGARLGELRLDTDLDVAHGVTRYLELLKLAALHARPAGQESPTRCRASTRRSCRRRPRSSARSC